MDAQASSLTNRACRRRRLDAPGDWLPSGDMVRRNSAVSRRTQSPEYLLSPGDMEGPGNKGFLSPGRNPVFTDVCRLSGRHDGPRQ